MNNQNYRFTLYIIIAVIAGVTAIQVYWNYKNYLQNKEQFTKDVMLCLDTAVDKYYTKLAAESTLGFTFDKPIQDSPVFPVDSLLRELDIDANTKLLRLDIDSSHRMFRENLKILKGSRTDSLLNTLAPIQLLEKDSLGEYPNPLDIQSIKVLTSKIIISIKNDSISLKEVDAYLKKELKRKNTEISYGLRYKLNDKVQEEINGKLRKSTKLRFNATSPFLPKNSELSIFFSDATRQVLLRSAIGIIISCLLILSVICILFYLLKIIKEQKQLAEIKNDLISNITHEFKTPIATVGVALESMKDFNVLDDREKTKSYINMSENQLSKLNIMIERLLETASMDSGNLRLNKERFNLVNTVESLVNDYQIQVKDKILTFKNHSQKAMITADAFHLENAISNIIDNAIKYGGKNIEVVLTHDPDHSKVSVKDDGKSLKKTEAKHLFDKFYRVPQGNTHNVKGFGIGLYYTKQIIEKHGGKITVELSPDGTEFKIEIPNE